MVPSGGVGRLVPVSTFCGRVRSGADFVFGAFLLLELRSVGGARGAFAFFFRGST
jgi:hypothetical protein